MKRATSDMRNRDKAAIARAGGRRASRGAPIASIFCALLTGVLCAALRQPVTAAEASRAGLLRYVAPARLTPHVWLPGTTNVNPVLVSEIARTREILARFREAGFSGAVWAVNDAPAGDDAQRAWLDLCLGAFPDKPAAALDVGLNEDPRGPALGRLEAFMDKLLQKEPGEDARVRLVLANYTGLDNRSCSNALETAAGAVRRNVERLRAAGSGTPVWILVNNGEEGRCTAGAWLDALADGADGVFLDGPHNWRTDQTNGFDAVEERALALGKPVIRSGFIYQAPRLRPGIEKELEGYYGRWVGIYEHAIRSRGFAGYCRWIGREIPNGTHPTLDYTAGHR